MSNSNQPPVIHLETPHTTNRTFADLLPSRPKQTALPADERWNPQSVILSKPSSAYAWLSPGPELPLSGNAKQHSTDIISRIFEGIKDQIRRGSPVDLGTLSALLDAIKNQNGVGLDDRKFLLEHILVLLSRLPPDLTIGMQIEHFLLDLLWNDLPHPPATFLAPFIQTVPSRASALGLKGFAYREADGSNNNPLIYSLGAAHTPYARSVASSHVAPMSTLPDPAVIFDTLLKRDKEVEHPTGFSSLFFAFANFIIHSLFRTNPADWRINDTSSYLDLSPLYGVDQASQDLVRRRDGTGRLWDDTFADSRLLAMPPSVAALLVVFNRNHNFIATRILEINEYGTYSSNPSSKDAQDDEVFNRARLVNCGTFMQVIMRDYVGSILHMIPDLSSWSLSPFDAFRGLDHELAPRGVGNACSVEFNLLYRWHASTSATNTQWLEAFWKKLFPNKGYDEVTPKEFGEKVGEMYQGLNKDPKTWPIADLKRDGKTGRFDDGDLANILQSATAETANAFRARGIPHVFKVIEVLGVLQARSWGVCSLNEFRKFLSLKPYSSFKEWNPAPEIYEAAERLYHNIDNLELYVGMQAEESRPSIPGSGLCSGFTMSRAILADAVTLIRGDRFLTTEYTPNNLTSWGFRDTQTEDNNGSFGGMLTKVLLRTLPRHYQAGSAYAHFPFIAPRRMREFMMAKDPEMVSRYTWYLPPPAAPITTVNSFDAVKEVVTVSTKFGIPYELAAGSLTDGYGFYLGSNDSQKFQDDRVMMERALFTPTLISQHAKFYHEMTKELIADKSLPIIGTSMKTVDIVAHVINYTPVYWVATRVGDLSLATKENPDGKYSEQELYAYLSVVFTYIFLNNEPVNSWFLEHHAKAAATLLLEDVKKKLEEFSSFSAVRGLTDALKNIVTCSKGKDDGDTFLHNLCETNSKRKPKDLAYNVFGVIVNSVASWAHAMTHVVDFYLDDARKSEKKAIVALSGQPITPEIEQSLIGYIKEALRLDLPACVAGVFREVRVDSQVSGTQLQAGQTVVANLASANVDESHYGPDASTVNPKRTRVEELEFVVGAHSSANKDFSDSTMAHVLHAIFSKKNLRRASGASGQLTQFTENVHGTSQKLYLDSKGQVSRWPLSLLVQYDI